MGIPVDAHVTTVFLLVEWNTGLLTGKHLYIYRQSPVKSPDIKNIIVVTLTFLYVVLSVCLSVCVFSSVKRRQSCLSIHSDGCRLAAQCINPKVCSQINPNFRFHKSWHLSQPGLVFHNAQIPRKRRKHVFLHFINNMFWYSWWDECFDTVAEMISTFKCQT